jgi:ferredoxin
MKVGEKCVGCGQCAAYCAFDAIVIFGRAAMNENCTECGKCIKYCPISAIMEVK